MEINSELIKKNIDILMGVYSELLSVSQNMRSAIDKYDDIINMMSEIRLNLWYLGATKTPDSLRLAKLLTPYNSVIKTLKLTFNKKNSKRAKFKKIDSMITGLGSNIYHMKIKNNIKCENCNSFLIRHRNLQYCQTCSEFKNKIYLFKDEEAEEDIKQNRSNIPKHFEANLNKIYGAIDEKSMPPEPAITRLREILANRNFDIHSQVHYSKSMINQLKKIGEIEYPGGKYNFASQTAHVNHIIQRLYPKLEIPQLSSYERIILQTTFEKISAEFQQLYPNLYNNSYQYTIHRILHMRFPNVQKIRTLLRFIYFQNTASFATKDQKLNEINNRIRCFPIFAYLPLDIYDNKKYYIV